MLALFAAQSVLDDHKRQGMPAQCKREETVKKTGTMTTMKWHCNGEDDDIAMLKMSFNDEDDNDEFSVHSNFLCLFFKMMKLYDKGWEKWKGHSLRRKFYKHVRIYCDKNDFHNVIKHW